MSNDDLLEDPAYFNRKFDADKAAERERLKAREALDAPPEEKPLHGLKLLQSIVADNNESRSIRMDAERLIDLAELRPREFQQELNDFLAWYAETK